jgi:ADP-ribose pyrophosphatase YjhB (NUDIX family)
MTCAEIRRDRVSAQAPWQHVVRFGQRVAGLLLRPKTLGVRAVALDDDNRVFLVRHTYLPGFFLPGGGVEARETALRSLERELDEEGGLAMTGPARLVGFYYNPNHSSRDHVVLYLVRARQTRPRRPDWEIAECGFYPLDALPPDTTASTRAHIQEALGFSSPSAHW